MKIPVKKFFPILLAALGLVFAVLVYFIGLLGTERGIYTDIGTSLTEATEEEIISGVLNRENASNAEIPAVKYIGGARTVGESVDFRELFQFTYQDGLTIQGTDDTYLIMYLKDIQDASGNSVCEKLTTEDIEAMEEIPSAFVFDKEESLLYFHKSGAFKVLIKVYYDANTYVEYEFSIPVEVG